MKKRTIYLNNAATTWPKPRCVVEAVLRAMEDLAGTPGRAVTSGLECERAIFHAREEAARFIGASDSSRVIFTPNATAALNLAITGLLKEGDHVVTTSMDHNSVARPLKRAADEKGVEVRRLELSPAGTMEAAGIMDMISPNTRLIVLTEASNVTGSIQPVREVAGAVRAMGENRPLILVDAAQTAGVLPINVEEDGVDLLAVPGHKSLYGPQGTGFLYIAPGVSLDPLMEGGTGGRSELTRQPESLPDRFESGTPNTPGIVALGKALKFLSDRGLEKIREEEIRLMDILMDGLTGIRGVALFGPHDPMKRVGVLSFNVEGMDPAEVGSFLETTRGIILRVGLHCSPHSHRTIGTFPEGTVRISTGIFNTEGEIIELVQGVKDLLRARG
ncbi:MAG: aminotransferase class V-fold PLP-dependent enzyme [Deltaproteobacteria bacterium]|nr:aminotransferase class V-fold PLP-dependent enzyme [Deltaproteobacteria bacterium]